MSDNNDQRTLQISERAALVSGIMVALLLVGSIILSLAVKPGTLIQSADGSYTLVSAEVNMPLWKYILSPILVLTPVYDSFVTVWSIVFLVIVIGAVFAALDKCGILVYMVKSLAARTGKKKYLLLFAISFLMMFMGTTLGVSEEVIPLVPIAVMLFYALGWDSPLAIMATDLSACVGFTVGVINPFNTGLAQSLSDEITMYSGVGFRALLFIPFYGFLFLYMYLYAKRLDRNPQLSVTYSEDEKRRASQPDASSELERDPDKDRALKWFATVIVFVLIVALINIGACTLLSTAAERKTEKAELYNSISSALSGSILYMIILGYTVAGIGACIKCGLKGKELRAEMRRGTVTLLPSVLLCMLASAIGFIFNEAGITDPIVFFAAESMGNSAGFVRVIFLFLFLLILEIFIPSASGKALLIMPLVYRLCTLLGINHQVAVLAFIFADGFANSLLPSNSGLLMTLGMTPVSYPKWLKSAGPLFAVLFILAIGALMLANNFVY